MILAIICLIFAGCFKGAMDYHSETTKQYTWVNKWKNWNYIYDIQRTYYHWWYFGFYTPDKVEKFPYSSTILSFTTDYWHFYQFLFLRFLYLGILLMTDITVLHILFYTFIIIPVVVGCSFQLMYKYLKK